MPHVSTLKLNQYRYGELEGPALDEVRAHLAECDRCSKRLGAQQNNRAAFELEPVPEAISTVAAIPEPANRPGQWVTWVGALAFAAAAVLLVVPTAEELTTSPLPTTSDTRIKGAGQLLEVWVDRPAGPVEVGEGEAVHPGDRIQLRIRRPPNPWVTLAGTDASGDVEIYGSWKANTDAGGWQKAPFALGMDDTPGEQSFHAVFTPNKPAPKDVEQMLENGSVPKPAQVETIVVENQP